MTGVGASHNDNFESLLRRFSRKVQQDGILSEVRRRTSYEKPSAKRKRKEVARKRRAARVTRH